MNVTVRNHDYGKSEISFVTARRTEGGEELTETTAAVAFEEGFEKAFATGDNATILPTGAMANTVLAFAPEYLGAPPERFALALAEHLAAACPAAGAVTVRIASRPWQRIDTAQGPDPTGFTAGAPTQDTAKATVFRDDRPPLVSGGLSGLRLVKTTDARFTGFLRDEFTTIPDFHDRLMGLAADVEWEHDSNDGFDSCRSAARAALLRSFSEHTSLSGQHTLYVLGSAVLTACPDVTRVHLTCSANDHLPADLARFGRANGNQVYLAPATPYSLVHLTLEPDGRTPADPGKTRGHRP
ncbi:urate oxidase [Kitasatospora purpeofusca]|uniref:factor-independent urate hydroxylase n=1 Tax=Kitasatospora purpeofusca TaxID=67352 RepID=UPI002E0FCDF7|nr:urate oxidase [Kitasatospora purpeofusca]WSR29702.1 urate oxidase [Kitasatospora purpeofusca]WSR37929.1 urate oxidase [Kitasatospora purpeofusca]